MLCGVKRIDKRGRDGEEGLRALGGRRENDLEGGRGKVHNTGGLL